ncbi:MAG: dTDP-4-dehydrorhamnose 3,5-epimerase [Planctomycetes bacterium]|nr:dTDP-4-dehydrorhamnose 3,5-epimerase [Planctomycetota bacterium]
MPFDFQPLPLPGLFLARPRVFSDGRGSFMETWRRDEFERAGIAGDFMQDNSAKNSKRGVLRGLHFQRDPHAQAKLVRCVRGRIFDVAVDLRPGSPTAGRHLAVELDGDVPSVLCVPRGFAHGYLTLTDESEVEYKVDAPYAPESEGGLAWDDLELGIPWPVRDPLLNERDRKWPGIRKLLEARKSL